LVLSFNIEIKTLPYEVCELTNLVILKLEAVKLMGRLTQGMGYLTSLEQLMLANNSIVSLPSGLGNATGLKVLDLDRNYTLELPPIDVQAKGYPQNFEFMKRLAESERHGGLDLKNFKLSNLEFFKFAVCGHEIQKLDEPLERGHPWTQVTALDLSANRLGELQDIIGDFESLTSLKCNGNRLSALPECFTRLTCLQVLHLADNSFREFPAICCFGDQGNLVEEKKGVGFDVSALGIDEYEVQTVWSPGIPHQALTDLDVSGNQLHNIHKAVARISQLTSLNVAKNKVSKMPPDFRDLTSLAKIDISSNDFNVFPNDIWFCTNLTILRVAHNRIKEIPSLIQNLKLLEELDLSFNKFTDLPVEVGTLKYLKKPLFTGNTLKGIPRNLAKGGDVAIMSFWKAMVESKRTKKFDVSNTGMVDLPTQIEHMTWLKDLNLCDNGLVRIPPQISALSLVEHLNLARNRLTTLPKEV
jgi:Leucine-rich repeat (LRR) protein